MNGRSTSRSAWSTTGMLTAFVTMPPSSAATICSATMTPARSCASPVEAARCGVTTTSSSPSSGPSYGSLEKTSSAAPASFPDAIASASASSSTSAPRAAFTSRAPSRMCAIASRSIRQRVSSVSGEWSVTTSDAASSSSTVSACSTPRSRKRSAPDERVVRDDRHPEPERAARDLLADPPEADDAERLPGDLDAAPTGALPPAVLERGVRLRDVPREREDQADRLLGRRDDRRLRRVRDDDPAARRRGDVHVVDPDARAADHLQPVGPLDDAPA